MQTKNYSAPWTTTSGGPTGYADAFGVEPRPNAVQLADSDQYTVAAVFGLIAEKTAEVICKHSKMIVGGMGQRDLFHAGPLEFRTVKHLKTKHSRIRKYADDEIREVTGHPFLDALEEPNETHTKYQLIRDTISYTDTVGNAYWLLTDDPDNPVYILRAQFVVPLKDDRGKVVQYQYGTGNKAQFFDAEDVIHFRSRSLFDPYTNTDCTSPVQSVWLQVRLQLKEISSWDALTTNLAHPEVAVTPKTDDGTFDKEVVREQFNKSFQERHNGANRGGVLALPYALDFKPISWNPKDLAGLQLNDDLVKAVCHAARLPTNFLDMQESSWASSEVADRAVQQNAISPRIENLLGTLNKFVHRRYGKRIMIVCEEFEAEDKQLKLAQQTADMQAVTAGLLTDNEWRTKYGYPPADDGDARRQPTQPQADPFGGMFGGAGSGDTTQQPKAVTTKAVPRPTIKQFIQVLQGVFGQQAKRVLGEMKSVRKAIPNGTWYDLDADLSAMASQLQPIVEAFFDQASGQLVQRLGFNDAVPKVVNASIPEAARSAVLAFCQATNDTTSQELDSALAATRKALEDGLSQGEAANQLTRRVQQIFENLQTDRAYRIAVTEQSRAQHTSELLTLNAAGVDAKKVWLDTELNACDECKALHGKTVGLNENFVTKGTGAYSEISAPPLHCHCRCSLDYVVDGS